MAWATVQDIRDRWLDGELPYTDEQVQTMVEDAEDIIAAEYRTVDARIASGELSTARVVRVVARMVVRVLKNPDGVRQRQETRGSFTGSVTYGGDNPGELYLSDEDRRDLGGSAGRGRAFSFMPAGV